jgi:hypothetical protein
MLFWSGRAALFRKTGVQPDGNKVSTSVARQEMIDKNIKLQLVDFRLFSYSCAGRVFCGAGGRRVAPQTRINFECGRSVRGAPLPTVIRMVNKSQKRGNSPK